MAVGNVVTNGNYRRFLPDATDSALAPVPVEHVYARGTIGALP